MLYADGKTTMTGGGANEFVFKTTGSNTIKDFHASATNDLVFSNAGLELGLAGGPATPTELTAAAAKKLFATGNFTNSGQLFASSAAAAASSISSRPSDHSTIGVAQPVLVAGSTSSRASEWGAWKTWDEPGDDDAGRAVIWQDVLLAARRGPA